MSTQHIYKYAPNKNIFGALSSIQVARISLFNKNPENLAAFGAKTQEWRLFSDNERLDPEDQPTFFYPDYTVGSGISPGHAPEVALAGFTAGQELANITGLTLPRRIFNCIVIIPRDWQLVNVMFVTLLGVKWSTFSTG